MPLRERQQGYVARLLDGAGYAPLMSCANTGQTTGHNFAAFGDKALQQADVAVGDCIDLFHAELANLLAAEKLAPARTPAGAACAWWTRGRRGRTFLGC